MDAAPRPYTLIAELTHRCPLRCPYCSNPTDLTARRQELDTSDWLRLVDEAEDLGVLQLDLSGGEPLLRDDLEAIVRGARARDLYVTLITSGVPLSSRRLATLRTAGLDAVQLSFQDVDAGVAQSIAGADVAEQKQAAARWTRELGLALTVNVVLHRDNIERTAAFVALACALGAERLELANVQYAGWALLNRAALMPSAAQLAAARAEALAAARRLRGRIEVVFVVPDYQRNTPPPCMDGWGRRFIVVTPDGTALPCHAAASIPGLEFGSVRERPLAELWSRSPGMTAFRGEAWLPEPCRSCERRTIDFGGCRCRAHALTGDAAGVDPVCELSPHHALVEAARREAGTRVASPRHRAYRGGVLAMLALAGSLSWLTPRAAAAAPPDAAAGTVPAWARARADDGEWRMPARDYASTRFSPLDDITADNVGDLKLAWTFDTGVLRGQEAAPLVVGDTMYVVTPYPNTLYALDLRAGGTVKWKYEPGPATAAQGVACCDVVNRGAAFDQGLIFYNTLDAHTVAVDAATGRERWKVKLGDINRGETMTMAPLVVEGKVLVGNSGGELGVRGWLTALDAQSGAIAWRAYSTGPDADVLIGDQFRPFYPQDRGRDLGVSSWPSEAWKIGGGTVWGWISYDPELRLVYYGTGNPGPWNPAQRPGDNKWTAGIFARRPDDGQAVWALQWSPHDLHDYDGINEQILLDLPIGGRTRQVLVRPERNGYVYVVDRTNGEILSATAFAYITSTRGIDLRTGRPMVDPGKEPKLGTVVRQICPAPPGAKDWQPSSYSPRTGWLYIPVNNLCYDAEGLQASYIAGTPYLGMNARMYAGPGGYRGELIAWDPVAAQARWRLKEDLPIWSGTVVTAGDVVFYGTMDGRFRAVDARSGERRWEYKTRSGIIGQPVTYRGPDGKQYVAVLAGVGGWSGAIVSGALDPRDGSGALGFVNAMIDLPGVTAPGGDLYVFALP